MKIESGLFDHMVLQRTLKNVCDARIEGSCDAKGQVTTRVTRGGKAFRGFASAKVGVASQGSFKANLKGLPAGGPYDVELFIGGERILVQDVLVGDVWLLAGQSNMQGCGLVPEKPLPVNPMVRAFYSNDRWAPAEDPIHSLWESVDPVHAQLFGGALPPKPAKGWGVCPGPAFGVEMIKFTGVPQGLIACAHGGTTMAQWSPKLKGEGGTSLYGAMLRKFKKNGGKVAGMLWYQGCSDSGPVAEPVYTHAMKEFISTLRRDCGDSRLPVALAQISRTISLASDAPQYWNGIQEQQRVLPRHIKNLSVVPTVDLALDDLIHLGGESQYILGRRLANAMRVLRNGRKAGLSPIEFNGFKIMPHRDWSIVEVSFKNVDGGLVSGGRPFGFSIINSDGKSCVFDTKLSGEKARIFTTVSPVELRKGWRLHYGYGLNPCCNITDDAGRSLPVFGPVWLGPPISATPMIQKFLVSDYHIGDGGLKRLKYPEDLSALNFRKIVFPGLFCSMRNEISTHDGRDEYFFYSCRISCKEHMKIMLMLGHEGPAKAWIDGVDVYYGPKGGMPASPGKGASKVASVAAGEHEILVALDTDRGKGCGIFLQVARCDLTREQVLSPTKDYAMPEVLG